MCTLITEVQCFGFTTTTPPIPKSPSISNPVSFSTSTLKGNTSNTNTTLHQNQNMPRNVKKEHLPSKVCVICKRPFTWRKKWERVWDEVTTCSKSCNHKRKVEKQQQNKKQQDSLQGLNDNLMETADTTKSMTDELLFLDAELNTKELPCMEEPTDQIRAQLQGLHCDEDSEDISESDHELDNTNDTTTTIMSTKDQAREERKKAKKLAKAKRRAERQGKGDPSAGQKQCDVCSKSVDLLIRCTIDESQSWKLVCGKCWNDVSGGVVDGDSSHPFYRYGGLWKNRRAQNKKK